MVSKTESVNVLLRWLDESQAQTIGDVGNFRGRRWVFIDLGAHEVVLNADTKRAAVEAFVRANDRQPERQWLVVANRRGRINKVIPGLAREALPGWYAYTTRPLSSEGVI